MSASAWSRQAFAVSTARRRPLSESVRSCCWSAGEFHIPFFRNFAGISALIRAPLECFDPDAYAQSVFRQAFDNAYVAAEASVGYFYDVLRLELLR